MNAVRQHLADLRPLRRPGFRNLWIGSSLSVLGGQFATVAVLYQVWELTHDPFWTGLIGIATAAPILVFALFGGSLADRFDRRRVHVLTTGGQLAASAGLAAQAFLGLDHLALVLTLVGLTAGFGSLGAAARRALPPRLLPPEELRAGLALQSISFQAAMLVGPVLAGLALGVGLGFAYAVDTASFAVCVLTALRIPPVRPEITTIMGDGGTLAGLTLIGADPVLRGSFLVDLAATVLAMPVALFPLVNQERFDGNPRTLGLFFSALAVGGLVAGLFSGALAHTTRPGPVQLAAAAVWGLALAGFGLVGLPVVTFACLAVAGAADVVSVVTRGALVQGVTPDRFRGRVGAVEFVVGVAGPEVGNFRAGLVGSLAGAGPALAIGGFLATAAVGAVAATNRDLRSSAVPGQLPR